MKEINANSSNINKLEGVIELFLEHSSRINEAKPQKYWYPLSVATYGKEEILNALESLCNFRTSMWEKTSAFERKFSKFNASKSAVMVNSGSSADLLISFLLTNPLSPILEPGDEVIMPIVTWPTHIWSTKMAGLTVKFVDVDPKTLNIDIKELEKSISPKTKAIFLVHLMGNPCQMDAILELAKKHNFIIIEDCCEALGSEFDGVKVGNFGLAGSFSFFFSHHMMTMEGGMIVCNDEKVVEQLKILRAHGWIRNVDPNNFLDDSNIDERYKFVNWGFNVRPTDLQAAFGLCQLDKLPAFNVKREELSNLFFKTFENNDYINFPVVSSKAKPSWLALPIMISSQAPFSRNEITKYLEENGVETRPIVAGNLAKHPVGNLFNEFKEKNFTGADKIHENGFYIGLSPFYNIEMIERLAELFVKFFKRF